MGGPDVQAQHHYVAGVLALAAGEVTEAERLAHETLALARSNGYRWEGAMTLELLNQIAAATGSPLESVRLMAAASRLRDDNGISYLIGGARDRVDAALATCSGTLADDAYEAAWAEGYALSLDEAVEYAQRSRGQRKRPTLGWESLTPTELLVVEQIEAGLSNPEIAGKLLIPRDTVKTHLAHIFTKLDIKNRAELAAAAARRRG